MTSTVRAASVSGRGRPAGVTRWAAARLSMTGCGSEPAAARPMAALCWTERAWGPAGLSRLSILTWRTSRPSVLAWSYTGPIR